MTFRSGHTDFEKEKYFAINVSENGRCRTEKLKNGIGNEKLLVSVIAPLATVSPRI